MRLVNAITLQLETFNDGNVPPYAILSHCWEEDELSFTDLVKPRGWEAAQSKKGFRKLKMCCAKACIENLDYIWIDTVCIDKSSSAELQEAINSMFRWYAQSTACYAYLSDVDINATEKMHQSRWFRRGWTLQEMLAPRCLWFIASNWTRIGSRKQCQKQVTLATGIPSLYLQSAFDLTSYKPCVADILSWAAYRETTRIEDRAYSLLGLLGINLPLLYGEGERAFTRVQEEVLRQSDDQSIFAWVGPEQMSGGLLAPSPDNFAYLLDQDPSGRFRFSHADGVERRRPHTVTNEGIEAEFLMLPVAPDIFAALLNLPGSTTILPGPDEKHFPVSVDYRIGLYVKRIDDEDRFVRTRLDYPPQGSLPSLHFLRSKGFEPHSSLRKRITVVRHIRQAEWARFTASGAMSFNLAQLPIHFSETCLYQGKGAMVNSFDARKSMLRGWPGNYGALGIFKDLKGSVELSSTRLGDLILGFDHDFHPVCIVTLEPLVDLKATVQAILDCVEPTQSEQTGVDDRIRIKAVPMTRDGGCVDVYDHRNAIAIRAHTRSVMAAVYVLRGQNVLASSAVSLLKDPHNDFWEIKIEPTDWAVTENGRVVMS
jgi:hypothetical protein